MVEDCLRLFYLEKTWMPFIYSKLFKSLQVKSFCFTSHIYGIRCLEGLRFVNLWAYGRVMRTLLYFPQSIVFATSTFNVWRHIITATTSSQTTLGSHAFTENDFKIFYKRRLRFCIFRRLLGIILSIKIYPESLWSIADLLKVIYQKILHKRHINDIPCLKGLRFINLWACNRLCPTSDLFFYRITSRSHLLIKIMALRGFKGGWQAYLNSRPSKEMIIEYKTIKTSCHRRPLRAHVSTENLFKIFQLLMPNEIFYLLKIALCSSI